MSKLISPNELQSKAIEIMLNGRKPTTREDWQLCANFWAVNIANGLEATATPLIGVLFDCPLSYDELVAIAQFQADRKARS